MDNSALTPITKIFLSPVLKYTPATTDASLGQPLLTPTGNFASAKTSKQEDNENLNPTSVIKWNWGHHQEGNLLLRRELPKKVVSNDAERFVQCKIRTVLKKQKKKNICLDIKKGVSDLD